MIFTTHKLPSLLTMASLPSKAHVLRQLSTSSTRNYRLGRSILFSEAVGLSIFRRGQPDRIWQHPLVPRSNSSFSVHFSAENPKPDIKPSVDPNPAFPSPGPPSIPPGTSPTYPHDPNPDPLPPEVPTVPEIPPSPDPSWPIEVPNINPAPQPEIFPPTPNTTNPVPPPLEVPPRQRDYLSGIRDPSIFPPRNPPPDISPPIPPLPPRYPPDFPPPGPRRPNIPPMPSPDIPPFPDPRPPDTFPPIPSPPLPEMPVLFPSFSNFKLLE